MTDSEKTITAEEFFRKKLYELKPKETQITLSLHSITAEQAMRWAHEFAQLKLQQANAEKQELINGLQLAKLLVDKYVKGIGGEPTLNNDYKIINELIHKHTVTDN